MKEVKSFTDRNKKKGKIGSIVKILKETMYLNEGDVKEVIKIVSHGGNGTYLEFKDMKSSFADSKSHRRRNYQLKLYKGN